MPQVPSVSVVLPSRNRAELLRRCLDSIGQQDYPSSRFEIIVVDDFSEDQTTAVVAAWAASSASATGSDPSRPALRYLRQPRHRGVSCARNTGIGASTGELIAFIDDDCMAETDWLRELVNGLSASGAAGVGGRVRLRTDQRITLAGAYMLRHRWYEQPKMIDTGCAYLLTNNCLYTRRALEEADLFDENFPRGGGGEDAELGRRLRTLGFYLRFRPEAVVWHRLRTSLRDLLHTAYRYGMGAAAVASRYPEHEPAVGPALEPGWVPGGRRRRALQRPALGLVDLLVTGSARSGGWIGSRTRGTRKQSAPRQRSQGASPTP